MEEVALGTGLLIEPTLGPGMLAVPAVTFLMVGTTVAAQAVMVVGINVDDFMIGIAVGVCESVEETCIAYHVVSLYDVMQSDLEFNASLALSIIVIAIGDLAKADAKGDS